MSIFTVLSQVEADAIAEADKVVVEFEGMFHVFTHEHSVVAPTTPEAAEKFAVSGHVDTPA